MFIQMLLMGSGIRFLCWGLLIKCRFCIYSYENLTKNTNIAIIICMERTIYQDLLKWKVGGNRKPLIVKGARQTGKTWIINKFGENEFNQIHYLNFQKSKILSGMFKVDLSPAKIVSLIEFHLDTNIDISNDLVFFDEIQDCPRAITSLKYFYEELPQLALVCAGSLLGVVHSDSAFPVGKVSFLNLYSLSFEEFLLAVGDRKSYKVLEELNIESHIPEVVHYHLLERLKEYMITGGMPEVLNVYIENINEKYKAFNLVRDKQRELITGYMGDFSKYSGKINSTEIVSDLNQFLLSLHFPIRSLFLPG